VMAFTKVASSWRQETRSQEIVLHGAAGNATDLLLAGLFVREGCDLHF